MFRVKILKTGELVSRNFICYPKNNLIQFVEKAQKPNIDVSILTDLQLIDLCIEKFQLVHFAIKRTGGYVPTNGMLSCALCLKYHPKYSYGNGNDYYKCTDCPIYKFTNRSFCVATPYEHYDDASGEDDVSVGALLTIVKGEIKFLQNVKRRQNG